MLLRNLYAIYLGLGVVLSLDPFSDYLDDD